MDAAPTAHAHQVGEGVGRSRIRYVALLWLPRTDLAKAARVYLGERFDAYHAKVTDMEGDRQQMLLKHAAPVRISSRLRYCFGGGVELGRRLLAGPLASTSAIAAPLFRPSQVPLGCYEF